MKYRPEVEIYSSYNSLALSIIKSLREKLCRITIISKDPKWRIFIRESSNRASINIHNHSILKADYVVSIDLMEDTVLSGKSCINANSSLKKISTGNNKAIFVLPYTGNSEIARLVNEKANRIISINPDLTSVVLVGGIVDGGYEKETALINYYLKYRKKDEGKNVPNTTQKAHLLLADSATKEIVKLLFSYSGYGNITAVISRGVSLKQLVRDQTRFAFRRSILKSKATFMFHADSDNVIYTKDNAKQIACLLLRNQKGGEQTNNKYNKNIKHIKVTKSKDKTWIKYTIKVGKTIRYVKERILEYMKTLNNYIDKTKLFYINKMIIKRICKAASVVLLLIMLPYIFLFSSKTMLTTSNMLIKSSNMRIAHKAQQTSMLFIDTTLIYTEHASGIGFLEKVYEPLVKESYILRKEIDIKLKELELLGYVRQIFRRVVGTSVYDSKKLTSAIAIYADQLINKIGLLEGDLVQDRVSSFSLGNTQALKIKRQKYLALKNIMNGMSGLLGSDSPKTYALILQDSGSPKSTGGTIEAYLLMTFSKGRLNNHSSYLVDHANIKSRGKVSPPKPLSQHFGVDNWNLSLSNWDTEFEEAAKDIARFLERERGVSIDGIVTLDMELFEKLLTTINKSLEGSLELKLSEEQKELTEGVDIQRQRLVSGLEEIAISLPEINDRQFYELLSLINTSMVNNDIRFYTTDETTQKEFNKLGGKDFLILDKCNENCILDSFSIVESTGLDDYVEENIIREGSVSISIEENVLKHKLVLLVENKVVDLPNNLYESYIRVVTPLSAGHGNIEVVNYYGKEQFTPEIYSVGTKKEVGIYQKLIGGDKKAVVFSWETTSDFDFEKNGSYVININKQAFYDSYPIRLKVLLPDSVEIKEFLTDLDSIDYNTKRTNEFFVLLNMSKDVTLRIDW